MEQRKTAITLSCVKISKALNYTIEEVLDHDLDWINHISEELIRQDFNDMIFQMSLHGIAKEKLEALQYEFDNEADVEPKTITIPISQFQNMGLAFGRDNKTKVIRGKK